MNGLVALAAMAFFALCSQCVSTLAAIRRETAPRTLPWTADELGGIAGDVIDIRMFETSLMEVTSTEGGLSTGRVIYFPNSKIFTEVIATTSKVIAHVFQEITIFLDVTSDWEKAGALLEDLAKEEYRTALAAKEQIETAGEDTDSMSGYRDPRVMTEMSGRNIKLNLQFMAPTGQAAHMKDRIWRRFLKARQLAWVLDALDDPDDQPLPRTRRIPEHAS